VQQLVDAQRLPADEAAELLKAMIQAARSEDDPPIWFDWNEASVHHLLAAMTAYAGPVAMPAAFAAVPASADELRQALVQYVAGATGATRIGKAGLACTLVQSMSACAFLSGMEMQPWLAAVLLAAPLPGPLATLMTPRPRVNTGVCDLIAVNSSLWT
jgi:hypothetical protein